MNNSHKTRRGKALRGWLLGTTFLLFSLFLTMAASFADDTLQAEALLKGVEKRLSKYSSFTVTFEVVDKKLPKALGNYTVTADYDDGKILFLVEYPEFDLPNRRDPGVGMEKHFVRHPELDSPHRTMALLFRDERVWIYDNWLPKVQIRDWQIAVGNSALILFDPRTIGFSDLQSLGASITACLSLDGRAEEYRVEAITGDNSQEPQQSKEKRYAVTVKNDSPIGKVEKTYQIQEPSFRVEKIRFRNEKGDLTIEVDNQYDDEISPILPSVSKMLRMDDGEVDCDKTIKVISFSKKRFRDSHFTPKSIPIEHNTPFSDEVLGKTIGYWDSNKKIMVDHLIMPPRPKEPLKMDRNFWLKVLCGTGSLVILVILLFRAKHWWRENGGTKEVG